MFIYGAGLITLLVGHCTTIAQVPFKKIFQVIYQTQRELKRGEMWGILEVAAEFIRFAILTYGKFCYVPLYVQCFCMD